ncbi:F-box only protein 15 [Merluccius polli]|uniref:F-box only protein 15 n=1 Tax=Merluccius polli TaxID=89951 RepID=A0AA47M824_MERPO|nr:F-box only protein 15 [Merluccius polli]
MNDFCLRLPSEILVKILAYLDASSLFCISHVNKVFHQLANDDTIWHKLYLAEFGKGKKWRPKGAVASAQLKLGTAAAKVQERAAGHWKRQYLKAMAGYNVDKWKRDLRAISPYTGLPSQTESVLRNLGVSWELTLSAGCGQEAVFEQTKVHFFQSALTVRWSQSGWQPYDHMASLQLHGVVRVALKCPSLQRPGWRSLLGKFDAETLSKRSPVIGHDMLVKVMLLQPGLVVGIWRGTASIAFVIACFHFHRLVERSLLGTSICPYSGPVDKAPFDDIDPEYGLHGYSLHIVLHNTVAEIMSGHFSQLFCRKAQIQNGHIELVAISRTNLSQHTPLSGSITLPWKCEALDGTVENCCLMSLTLLDEAQHPFWCVSSPVSMATAKKPMSYDYDGEHLAMRYLDPDGRVAMELVRMEQPRQLFLIDLTLHVPLQKVNRHFGRSY